MLKYVAIFQALQKSAMGLDPEQLKRVACLTYKSPALDTEEAAKKWLDATIKSYPEKYYLVRHCVISFKESEKDNVETMLKNLIKMF